MQHADRGRPCNNTKANKTTSHAHTLYTRTPLFSPNSSLLALAPHAVDHMCVMAPISDPGDSVCLHAGRVCVCGGGGGSLMMRQFQAIKAAALTRITHAWSPHTTSSHTCATTSRHHLDHPCGTPEVVWPRPCQRGSGGLKKSGPGEHCMTASGHADLCCCDCHEPWHSLTRT
jgi:hypothetical protein